MTSAPAPTCAPPAAQDFTPIRVVIVDDYDEVRFLLAAFLELDGRFEVVAEANSPATALATVALTQPDVVLVDLRLGRGCGTSIIRDLREQDAPVCIVVVTASAAPHDHAAAFAAGADAVHTKSTMISTMVEDLAGLVERLGTSSRGCVGT